MLHGAVNVCDITSYSYTNGIFGCQNEHLITNAAVEKLHRRAQIRCRWETKEEKRQIFETEIMIGYTWRNCHCCYMRAHTRLARNSALRSVANGWKAMDRKAAAGTDVVRFPPTICSCSVCTTHTHMQYVNKWACVLNAIEMPKLIIAFRVQCLVIQVYTWFTVWHDLALASVLPASLSIAFCSTSTECRSVREFISHRCCAIELKCSCFMFYASSAFARRCTVYRAASDRKSAKVRRIAGAFTTTTSAAEVTSQPFIIYVQLAFYSLLIRLSFLFLILSFLYFIIRVGMALSVMPSAYRIPRATCDIAWAVQYGGWWQSAACYCARLSLHFNANKERRRRRRADKIKMG